MLNSVLAYSIVNGIILLFILLFKNKSLTSARYFLLLYLLFIITIAEQLYIRPIILHTTWFSYPDFPIRFIFSPIFYLYVASFLDPDFKLTNRLRLVLFAPMLVDLACFIAISIYAHMQEFTLEQRLTIISDKTFYLVRTGLAVIFSLWLNFSALKMIRQFRSRLKEVYADDSRLQIRWLNYMAISTLVFSVIWMGYYIAEVMFRSVPRDAYWPLFLLFGINIIVIGYFAALRPDTTFIFKTINREISGRELPGPLTLPNQQEAGITASTDDELSGLFRRIEACLAEVYHHNDLSLSFIADRLNASPHLVSKAIRQGSNISFYSYVNRFRIKKLLELMTRKENSLFTIHVLAQKCGFNSKTTLQKYFRECTGLTPSEALKKINAGEETIDSLLNRKN